MRMKQSDGETTWNPGQGAPSGRVGGNRRTGGPLRNPALTTGNLRNPGLTSGLLRGPDQEGHLSSQASAAMPTSTPGQMVSPAGGLSGRLPLERPSPRGGGLGQDDEEEDPEGVVTFRQHYARAEAAAAPDPVSIGLVRVVLFLLACVAAYSLQSHSQHHYTPGTISGGQVSQISYDAGWPLTYAHVAVGATGVPLGDVEPTPASRYIHPAPLVVDVLLLALPFWVLLECLWALWASTLKHYGPRSALRRVVAFGSAALPALVWVAAGLGVGLVLVFGQIDPSTLPKIALPVLAPVLPGFGLAAGAAAVLSIPPHLWRLDVGLYLLALLFPLLVLTALFYVYGCVFGRVFHRLFKRR
jgi:hypothetical protein